MNGRFVLNRPQGKVMGIAAGLADWTGVDVLIIRLGLIVAAAGTRSRTTTWKTGFDQIARRAGVPIVCAGPDYPTKRGIFGPIIHPTGDYEADMAPAFAFFRSLRPRYPDRAAFPGDPD